jgi:hypothetical protein
MHKTFEYVNELEGNVASEDEYNDAYECYRKELVAGNIDNDLVQYLNFFFQSRILIPIFSCSGHPDKDIAENTKGYILFRSGLTIEETVKLFRETIKTFISEIDFNLAIHYWSNDAIGYYLTFATKDLQPVLESIRKPICQYVDMYL